MKYEFKGGFIQATAENDQDNIALLAVRKTSYEDVHINVEFKEPGFESEGFLIKKGSQLSEFFQLINYYLLKENDVYINGSKADVNDYLEEGDKIEAVPKTPRSTDRVKGLPRPEYMKKYVQKQKNRKAVGEKAKARIQEWKRTDPEGFAAHIRKMNAGRMAKKASRNITG